MPPPSAKWPVISSLNSSGRMQRYRSEVGRSRIPADLPPFLDDAVYSPAGRCRDAASAIRCHGAAAFAVAFEEQQAASMSRRPRSSVNPPHQVVQIQTMGRVSTPKARGAPSREGLPAGASASDHRAVAAEQVGGGVAHVVQGMERRDAAGAGRARDHDGTDAACRGDHGGRGRRGCRAWRKPRR